ncbi:MAG: rhodanese-like domain-containing protein [Vicingaceae bacterium]
MEQLKIKLLAVFTIFISAFFISCSSNPTEDGNEFIVLEAKKFDQRLSAEKNPQVIDVRTPEEFSEGTMLHAVNYNLLDSTLHRNLANLNKDKTVFVFCQKGGRSSKAAELLKNNEFKSVIDLKGGLDAWYKADPIH